MYIITKNKNASESDKTDLLDGILYYKYNVILYYYQLVLLKNYISILRGDYIGSTFCYNVFRI